MKVIQPFNDIPQIDKPTGDAKIRMVTGLSHSFAEPLRLGDLLTHFGAVTLFNEMRLSRDLVNALMHARIDQNVEGVLVTYNGTYLKKGIWHDRSGSPVSDFVFAELYRYDGARPGWVKRTDYFINGLIEERDEERGVRPVYTPEGGWSLPEGILTQDATHEDVIVGQEEVTLEQLADIETSKHERQLDYHCAA